MSVEEIIQILESQKNTRGIANWKKIGYKDWSSYGIGLTQLKKIAKSISRNHKLGHELWAKPNFDLKIMGILLMEPKKCTKEEALAMVLDVDMWMMSHVFVQILFCKLPFAMEMAAPWREDSNFVKKRCGYAYLYYLSRDKRIEDSYFVPILDHIEKVIQTEENFVKDAMNNALFSIGQRSLAMNKRCLDIARKIGKVEVDYGDNTCQAVDVIKHLDSERMRKKFG